jgi:hypothetical protein
VAAPVLLARILVTIVTTHGVQRVPIGDNCHQEQHIMATTILDDLLTAAATAQLPRFALRPTTKIGRADALMVGVDNGNDAIKAAVFAADGTLHTIRVPAAYRTAAKLLGAEQEIAYRFGDQTIWVGAVALAHEGDALPVGPTRQRLVDPRMRQLLASSLVELLRSAGYAPGAYDLVVGFAVPNTEIIIVRDEAGQEQRTVEPLTRQALEQHLKGATWEVARCDEQGVAEPWALRVLTVLPQAQTAGTILAVTKAANGRTVSDYDGMVVLDLGGGDIHETEVTLRPRYQMLTSRIGDGSIRIARALKLRFPQLQLNDAQAQQALLARRLMVAGKIRDISADVEAVLDGPGQAIVAEILPSLRQARRFVAMTGGLTILLHDRLLARLAAEEKVAGEDYLVVDGGIAAELNAVGVLFGVAFAAARKG